MSDQIKNTGPMLASPHRGAKTRSGGACRAPAVHGKTRCRMHGGAKGSGASRANRNARRHGLFTGDAIEERRQIWALLGEARRLLEEMKMRPFVRQAFCSSRRARIYVVISRE
ncbi:HGGxSTG domain-containing protein [Bradyrhizobium sp. USDA 4506]